MNSISMLNTPMPRTDTGSDSDRVMGNEGNRFDAVFTNKKDNASLAQQDFLNLLVLQMQNQDFTDPMDNSETLNQMVQLANMQQIQEMASYSKTTYAMSLLGKTVTASRFTMNGDLDTTTGVVQKVSLVDNEYVFYIGGKKYTMSEIMDIQTGDDSGVPPIDTSGYKLEAGKVTHDSVEIKWQVPTEDEQVASELKYTVYYSKNKLETLEEVENATKFGETQKNNTSEKITGLDPDTEYYINVVVEDANGNKKIYKTLMVHTAKEE